jgi:tape measure domain-containing protein
MSLGFAMSEVVGSIGIELRLEREQFDADLQSLEALQNKALKFSPILNTGDISKQMGQFGDRSFKVTAIVDDKQLTALNKHLDLKQRHFAQVSNYFKSAALTPKVDLTGIKALDGQLDSIRSNIESLSGSSVSVGVDLDSSAIDAALGKLQSLQTRAAQSVRVASSGGTDTTQTEEDITKAIERGFKKASANSPAKALMDGLFKSVTAPVRLAFDVSKSALTSTIQGIVLGTTQEMSRSLGSGVSRALEQSLSGIGGTGAIGEALGETLVSGVVRGVKGLDQLPQTVETAIEGLPKFLEKALGVPVAIPTAPFKKAAKRAREAVESEMKGARDAANFVGSVGASVIGEERMRDYGLESRAAQRKAKNDRTPITREQAAKERQEALRRYEDVEMRAQPQARIDNFRTGVVEKLQDNYGQKLAEFESIDAAAGQSEAEVERAKQLLQEVKVAESQWKEADAILQQAIKDREQLAIELEKVNLAKKRYEEVVDKTPTAYKQILKDVAGADVPEDQRPELVVADEKLQAKNADALYGVGTNRIYVKQSDYDQIQQNKSASGLNSETRQYLTHEAVHGTQFGFGSNEGIQAYRNKEALTDLAKPDASSLPEYTEFLSRGYAEDVLPVEFDAEYRARELEKKRKADPKKAIKAQVTGTAQIGMARENIAASEAQLDKELSRLDRVGVAAPKTRGAISLLKQKNQAALAALKDYEALIGELGNASAALVEQVSSGVANAAQASGTRKALSGKLFAGFAKEEIVGEKARAKKQKPLLGARPEDIDANVDKFFDDQSANIDVPKKQFEKTYLKGDLWENPIAPLNSTTGYLNVQAGKVQAPPSRLEIAKEKAKAGAVGAATKARQGVAWLSSREYEIDTDKLKDRAVGAANIAGKVAGVVAGGTKAVAGGGRSVFRQLQAAGASTGSALAVVGENQTTQGIVKAGASVAYALGTAAKAGWSLAKGLESIVLDIMPAGRMVKGGIQQIALPAAGFAAATHFLPGGAVAAQGLQQMVGGVVGPMMGTGTNAIAGGAADFAMNAFPHAMGIASGVSGAATGAIHALGGAATEMAIQAGTVILGGKALQVGAGLAANGAVGAVKGALPSGENKLALPPAVEKSKPLALPAADLSPLGAPVTWGERSRDLDLLPVESAQEKPVQKAMSLSQPTDDIPIISTRKFEEEPLKAEPSPKKEKRKKPEAEAITVDASPITVEAKPAMAKRAELPPVAAKAVVAEVLPPVSAAEKKPDPVEIPPPKEMSIPVSAFSKPDALIQFTKNDISGEFGKSYAAAKAAFAAGDLKAASAHIEGIRRMADRAQADIGGFVTSLGDAAKMGTEVGNKLNGYKGTIGRYRGLATTLERKVNKAQPKPASDRPAELDEGLASLRKEALVGLAGFAGSQMIHGNVGAAIGGTVATMGARVGATVVGAGRDAYQGLKSDEVFKAASALDKFRMILEATGSKLSAKDVQDALGSELSGDLIGNLIGNAIPGMGGAAAGLVATPQLVKLREKISSRLSPGESAVPELNEGLARKSGDAVTGELSAKQQEVLKWAQGLLDQAIAQAENIDNLGEALTQQLGGFSERANLESDLSGLDVDKEIGRSPRSPNGINPETYARVKQEADAEYEKRKKEPSKDEAKERVKAATGRLSEKIGGGRAAAEIDEFTGALKRSQNPFSSLIANAGMAVKGFLGFTALSMAIPMLQQFGAASVQAAIKVGNLQTAMAFALGGNAKGMEAIKFARDTAEQLGTPMGASQEGFKKLAASTRGTAVEGQPTKDVFVGLQQASTVLGLTGDETDRAYLALSQGASKGKIQAEELRAQLGEVIPGVMSIAARSMGVTEAELGKLMETGSLFASDFLPKFGRQMQIEFGGASEDASKNLQSSFNRMEGANQKLQESFGQAIAPAIKPAIDAVGASLNLLANYGGMVAQSMLIFGGILTNMVLRSMFALPGAGALAAQAFAGMGKAVLGVAAAAGPLLLQFAAITAAIAVAQNIFARFGTTDAGAKFSELANSAEKNMDRIAKAAAKARGEVATVGTKPQENNNDNLANEGDFVDGALVQYNRANRAVNKFMGWDENLGSFKTAGESQYENDMTQLKRSSEGSQKLAAIDLTKDVAPALEKMQGLDAETALLQNRRRIVASKPKVDKAEIEKIDAQLKEKSKEKGLASDVVTSTQSAIEQDLAGKKKAREGILENTKMTDKQKAKPLAIFDADIKSLEAAKSKMDELTLSMKTSVSAGAELSKQFTEIASEIDKAAEAREKLFSEKRIATNTADLAGFKSDTLNSPKMALKRAEAESESAFATLNDLQNAQTKRKGLLTTDAASSAMAAMPIGNTGETITMDSSMSDIEKARKMLGDRNAKNADQHDVLDNLKTYKESEKEVAGAREGLGGAELNRLKVQESATLAAQDKKASNAESDIKRGESGAIAGVKAKARKGRATNVFAEEDAAVEVAKIQLTSVNKGENVAKEQLAELEAARAAGLIGAEEYDKRQRDLSEKLADFKIKKEEAVAAVEEAVRRKAIEGMERKSRVAIASAELEAGKKTLGIKSGLLGAGVKNVDKQQQVSIATNDEELKLAATKTQIKQRELAEVKDLKAKKILSAKEAADREMALNAEIQDGNSKQLDLKLEKERLVFDQAIRQIEKQVDAQKRASDLAIAGYELQKSALSNQATALERRKSGLEAELKLNKAIADSRISSLTNRASDAGEAASSIKQLNAKDTGANLRKVLGQQASNLGFGGGAKEELNAVKSKAALEAEAENEKLAALAQQQEIERESIKLGLQREGISARIAVIEAKRAEVESKRNLNEAQGNLLKAKKGGDANEIANAEVGVQIAQQNVALSGEGTKLAEQGVGLVDSQAQKELQATAIQQGQARADAISEANRAQRQRERDIASTADSLGISGESSVMGSRRNFGGNPYSQASTDFAAYSQSLSKIDIPSGPVPSESRVEGLGGNQDIVKKLDELSGNIIQLANSPRSLSFATKDPVSDYSKWLNEQAGSMARQ